MSFLSLAFGLLKTNIAVSPLLIVYIAFILEEVNYLTEVAPNQTLFSIPAYSRTASTYLMPESCEYLLLAHSSEYETAIALSKTICGIEQLLFLLSELTEENLNYISIEQLNFLFLISLSTQENYFGIEQSAIVEFGELETFTETVYSLEILIAENHSSDDVANLSRLMLIEELRIVLVDAVFTNDLLTILEQIANFSINAAIATEFFIDNLNSSGLATALSNEQILGTFGESRLLAQIELFSIINTTLAASFMQELVVLPNGNNSYNISPVTGVSTNTAFRVYSTSIL